MPALDLDGFIRRMPKAELHEVASTAERCGISAIWNPTTLGGT